MVATPTTSLGFQNFFSTTLSADITDTATDVFLTSVPNVSEGFLVIEPDSTTNREVIYYTSKTALKVVCPSVADGRGQDDTTAHSHTSGVTVIMAPVAAYFEAMQTLFQTTPAGWTSITGSISAVTYNGNRSYSLTTSSDNSAVISPGMRLRTTRTVAAPTYMGGAFNGTNHYFTKATPSGTLGTVTNNFTLMGWVEPTAYQQGVIMGRSDSTPANGFILRMAATGQIEVAIYSGGAGNVRSITTYQSVPLNKKTHIAATWASGTVVIYFDGVSVPVQTAVTSGTAPTAAGTGGDWSIGRHGAYNAQYFAGYIAGAGVFDAVLSAATIRSYASQALSGSETNCIGAWSLNNTANDQNTAANNLTATNGVSYTSGRSPYATQASGTATGSLDYAIVQTVSASTLVVQVPEGCTIPTSGGVSACSYSSFKNPYGFPGQKGKWQVLSLQLAQATQPSPTLAVWYNLGSFRLNVPIGEWNLGFRTTTGMDRSVAGRTDVGAALDTSSSTANTQSLVASSAGGNANVFGAGLTAAETSVSLVAATTYYHNVAATSSVSVGNLYLFGTSAAPYSTGLIYADNAYL